MTDRHAGYVVVLADDIRDDAVDPIITALRMIKGVVGVEPVVSTPELQVATRRAQREFKAKAEAFIDSLG